MEASLIIGYHNEAGLVQLLLESITPNIKNRIEVILVDDASTQTYDYEYDGEIVKVKLEERKGIGNAFDVGVSRARTNNIILAGGDIVFKDDRWLSCFLHDLNMNSRGLYCGACLNLHEHSLDVQASGIILGYGAYINVFVEKETIFQTKWIGEKLDKGVVYSIPCVLGALYAITKEWYEYIQGFKGHLYWGCLEPYISIKNYMLGGTNLIDTRVEAGHWFIEKTNRFTVESWQVAYNKVMTTFVLGGDLTDKLFDNVNYVTGVDIAAQYLQDNRKKEIEELRDYVKRTQKRTLSQFMTWQNSLISKLGKS